MTKAEKKARKAQRAARVVVEKHAAIEQRAVDVIDSLNREVMELRKTQEVFREMLFGALLGRALGAETPFTDAMVAREPVVFASCPDEPWRVFMASSSETH